MGGEMDGDIVGCVCVWKGRWNHWFLGPDRGDV